MDAYLGGPGNKKKLTLSNLRFDQPIPLFHFDKLSTQYFKLSYYYVNELKVEMETTF